MIAVSDLGKSLGAQTLFSGVSIQFNPGNCYGLVGANDSGKSTLLRSFSGAAIARRRHDSASPLMQLTFGSVFGALSTVGISRLLELPVGFSSD